jgi:hypothetical protein
VRERSRCAGSDTNPSDLNVAEDALVKVLHLDRESTAPGNRRPRAALRGAASFVLLSWICSSGAYAQSFAWARSLDGTETYLSNTAVTSVGEVRKNGDTP